MIHIYTGNGKGKTTAALGLAVRALGHSMNIGMVQFMKNDPQYGEYRFLIDYMDIIQSGRNEFVDFDNPDSIDIELARKGLAEAEDMMLSGQYDIVILDEINVAVMFGLVNEDDVLNLMDSKPDSVEIIMTGRGATDKMIEKADLVTQMKEIKHYYTRGISAREGIEH